MKNENRKFRWRRDFPRIAPLKFRSSRPIDHDPKKAGGRRRLVLIMSAVVGDTPSGGDYAVQALAKSCAHLDVEITVVAAQSSIEHINAGFHERLLPIRGKAANSSNFALAYLARSLELIRISRKVFRFEKPDIVLTGSVFLPDLIAAFFFTRRATVWILPWQLDILPPGRKYFRRHSIRGARQVLRHGYRSAFNFVCQELALILARRRKAFLVVISRELRDRALIRGFQDSRVIVCGVTLERSASGSISKLKDRKTDFLFLGRFHAQKGLHDLLIAWDHIHLVLPHARLRVAGGGDDNIASWFVHEIEKRASSVDYLGIVKGDAKWDLLDDTRVVLFPSSYESLGIVVLEAFTVGAVVVGYEISSTTEAFGDGVIQVPLFEPHRLASAAVDIFENPDAWSLQQQKGFEMVEQYLSRDTPDSVALKVLAYSEKPLD